MLRMRNEPNTGTLSGCTGNIPSVTVTLPQTATRPHKTALPPFLLGVSADPHAETGLCPDG
jgi:hypothetical protein